MKRGCTVKFKKSFIEQKSDRELLIIEMNTKGYIRELFDNKVYVKIANKDLAIILKDNEINEYLEIASKNSPKKYFLKLIK